MFARTHVLLTVAAFAALPMIACGGTTVPSGATADAAHDDASHPGDPEDSGRTLLDSGMVVESGTGDAGEDGCAVLADAGPVKCGQPCSRPGYSCAPGGAGDPIGWSCAAPADGAVPLWMCSEG